MTSVQRSMREGFDRDLNVRIFFLVVVLGTNLRGNNFKTIKRKYIFR